MASSSRQSMRSLTCGNGPWRSWGRRQWPQMTKTRGEKWEKYVGWSGKNVGFHSVLDLVFHCVEISYKYVQVKKPSHVVIHDVQVNSSKISPSMRTVGTSIDLYFQCIGKPPSTQKKRGWKIQNLYFSGYIVFCGTLKKTKPRRCRRSLAVRVNFQVISKEPFEKSQKTKVPLPVVARNTMKYQL